MLDDEPRRDDDEPEIGPVNRTDSGYESQNDEQEEWFDVPLQELTEDQVSEGLVAEAVGYLDHAAATPMLKEDSAFQSMVGHIRSALNSTINGTQAFFDNLPGKVKSATSALCNAISEQSSKIWKAIKEGAKDKAKIIRAGFAAVLKKLAATFEAASHVVGKGKTALLTAAGKVQARAKSFIGPRKKGEGKAVAALKRSRQSSKRRSHGRT